jgi:hypothetical protein
MSCAMWRLGGTHRHTSQSDLDRCELLLGRLNSPPPNLYPIASPHRPLIDQRKRVEELSHVVCVQVLPQSGPHVGLVQAALTASPQVHP